MFILSTTLPNLFIPDVPFPALLSSLIRSWCQVKPARTLLIPIDPFLFLEEKFKCTRYQSGSFSLFSLPAYFFLNADKHSLRFRCTGT